MVHVLQPRANEGEDMYLLNARRVFDISMAHMLVEKAEMLNIPVDDIDDLVLSCVPCAHEYLIKWSFNLNEPYLRAEQPSFHVVRH